MPMRLGTTVARHGIASTRAMHKHIDDHIGGDRLPDIGHGHLGGATPFITKRVTPKGGVIKPVSRAMSISTPNQTVL